MSADVKPVFVIGSLGAGVELLAWCLGQHPNLPAVAETDWLGRLGGQIVAAHAHMAANDPFPEIGGPRMTVSTFAAPFALAATAAVAAAFRAENLPPPAGSEAPNRQRGHRAEPGEAANASLRWVDGEAGNAFHVAALLALYPRARFVHVVRDVQSVVRTLSSREPDERWARPLAFTPRDAYEHWLASARACVEAERAFGSGTVLRVRREDVLREPEASLRACLAFAGEEFFAGCLRPLAREWTAPVGDPA